MPVQVGEIYKTNNHGKVKVIEYQGTLKVKIRFLTTGNEKWTRSEQIQKGQVRDDGSLTKVGDIFETNYGKCKVIAYKGFHKVRIKFLKTGYKTWTEVGAVKKKEVKDPYYPSIKGYGYFGEGPYDTKTYKTVYDLFNNVLTRTVDEKAKKRLGYVGCSIDSEWLNFQTFCRDITAMPNWNSTDFELDKDYIVLGNKIYSKNTTSFIPRRLNQALPNKARGYSFKNGRYYAHIPIKYRKKFGYGFDTSKEAKLAFSSYRRYKARRLANKYKDQIDPRVYVTLRSYPLQE